uniref:Uncharacterized protein n=1 Tax=Romanomermis culicivorax TaxID=13658 RepID=A0A915IVV8_ROMCU
MPLPVDGEILLKPINNDNENQLLIDDNINDSESGRSENLSLDDENVYGNISGGGVEDEIDEVVVPQE